MVRKSQPNFQQKSGFLIKKPCKYRRTVLKILNLRYTIPKEILAVFHNESNHYYHIIIKELAEEFNG